MSERHERLTAAEHVAVRCSDCGHEAVIPLDDRAMICTECSGLNVPLGELLRDAQAALAEARAKVAPLREAVRSYLRLYGLSRQTDDHNREEMRRCLGVRKGYYAPDTWDAALAAGEEGK